MNRSILFCAACFAVAAGATCSNDANLPSQGSGGTGNGTGGSQGEAGTNPGSGGTSSTTGGSTTTGSSGSSDNGGSTGSGGSNDVGGGTSTGGGSAAGGSSGTGGSATAGSTGAGGGTGGNGGSGTGGNGGSGTGGSGGSGGLTPEAIVPTLDGFLWVGKCANAVGEGKDCPIHDDQDHCDVTPTDFNKRGAFQHAVHKVGGTAGTKYTINFEARGVTGGKNYNGGVRQSTDTIYSQTANDGWRAGGTPTDTKWNTYEIHVSPPVTGQPVNQAGVGGTCATCPTGPDNVYYTNSILQADGLHETFPVKIKASFPVMGGGTITLVIHDSNCLGQQNCGSSPDPNAMCTDPRTIDISGMSPPPASPFSQPYSEDHTPAPWLPQWLLFDVQSITQ